MCWEPLVGAGSNQGEEMKNIIEVLGLKTRKTARMTVQYLWLHCRVWIATFRLRPEGEIGGTNLSASPDARAEIPTVPTEAYLRPSASLKKQRPRVLIL